MMELLIGNMLALGILFYLDEREDESLAWWKLVLLICLGWFFVGSYMAKVGYDIREQLEELKPPEKE